jgi:hypothetical protein
MLYLHDFIRRVRARIARYRQEVVPGSEIGESIDIGRLICPLRYDLRVRIDFFRLLRDEWDRYTDDLDGFLERAESRAYYIWFKEVGCVSFEPRIYRKEKLVRPAFLKRVDRSAGLWRSIDRSGFDASNPIRLRSGRAIRRVNGKTINSIYFAGDGCHRIACLYLTGLKRLEPEHYHVVVQRHFEPLDNTAILVKHLPLDQTAHLKFISRFYCDGRELDSAERILQHVASEKADLLPELESVLAFDLSRLRNNG